MIIFPLQAVDPGELWRTASCPADIRQGYATATNPNLKG